MARTTSTPIPTFAEQIAALPFSARTQNGSGFFTPLWRASAHLTHLLAMMNEDDVEVTGEQAISELHEALEHLNTLTFPEGISTSATAQASAIQNITTALYNEWARENWTEEDKKTNLRNTIQRYAGLIAFLDRELTGLTGSDPGTSF